MLTGNDLKDKANCIAHLFNRLSTFDIILVKFAIGTTVI